MREALYPVPRERPPQVGKPRITLRLEPAVVIEVPSIGALRGFVQPVFGVRVSRVVTITEGAAPPEPEPGEGAYIPTFRPRRR